jgi:threonine synthase
VDRLSCAQCEQTFPFSEPRWCCTCGAPLDLDFSPTFDRQRSGARPPTIWRYREALPLESDANIVSFDEGFTPLLPVQLDGREVLLKQDHLFPTGSYKDRGAALLISKAKERGVGAVVEDSSGNAGAAIATYCARAGIRCAIYVPADCAPGKLAQIERSGAALVTVPGPRAAAARAARQAAQTTFYASHCWSPFFLHGTKTFAFEVCEQLGWKAPDTVVVPVGHGTLLLGAYIGFDELYAAGLTGKLPRVIAVQSERCAPLYQAFQAGLADPTAVESRPTLAEGIAIAHPVRGRQILGALRDTGGRILAVTEGEIEQALALLHGQGFFVEPTAAATIAGLRKYLPEAHSGEVIVAPLTGHGLKSTDKLLRLQPE